MYVIIYSYSYHARTLVTWKAPQTTARMSVNVFNLLNGSYKSKHWQKRGERTRAHCSLQNDYLLGLAKCEATPIMASFCLGGPYLLTLFRFFTFLSYNSGGFEYFQMSGGAKAPLALLGGSPLTPIIYTQVTIQSLTLWLPIINSQNA